MKVSEEVEKNSSDIMRKAIRDALDILVKQGIKPSTEAIAVISVELYKTRYASSVIGKYTAY